MQISSRFRPELPSVLLCSVRRTYQGVERETSCDKDQTIQARVTGDIDQNRIEAFTDVFSGTHMADMHVPGAGFVVVEDGQVARF
jgi:hypothetical protein